jgi:hypothetical protein
MVDSRPRSLTRAHREPVHRKTEDACKNCTMGYNGRDITPTLSGIGRWSVCMDGRLGERQKQRHAVCLSLVLRSYINTQTTIAHRYKQR